MRLSRRVFLATTGALTSALILQACAPAAPPTATPAPAAPAKPAAPAPTAAPVTAPVAAATPAVAGQTDLGLLRPTDGTPKRGGILKTAWGITTPHFDLHQGATDNVLAQLYNNLVRRNPLDGLATIVPELATKWDKSADGKTYTFTLRQGVKFHDGTPFTSADVIATYMRIIKPPDGVVPTNRTLLEAVTSLEAIDQHTVKFNLSRPVPYFLEALSVPNMGIYSKKSLDENNGDLKKIIAPGTGAFKFKDHKVGERWTFERNSEYWDKELPYLDGIEMIHAAAWSDRGTAVLTGQADLSWNVSMETWQEGQKRSDQVKVNQFPSTGAYMIYLNNAKKPLDDVNVRQAIHLGLSRQDLFIAFQTQEPMAITRYMSHASSAAQTPEEVAKLPGYRQDKTQDIADAKRLLADAGHGSGLSLELLSANVAPHAELLAPAVQDMLKQIGVNIQIKTMERALLNEELKTGAFDLCLNTIGFPTVEPITGWVSYLKTGASQNFSKYTNPEFDKLLEQIEAEPEESKRKDLYRKGLDILDQDSPWAIIGWTNHLPMWRTYVKGLGLDVRKYVEWGRLNTAWLDK